MFKRVASIGTKCGFGDVYKLNFKANDIQTLIKP